VPLQSLNLRAALFRCLNELKKNETLGKEVMIRKTMFDDCKGDKLQGLLASFSTIVLRKVLAEGHGGKASIAGRLAIAKRVTKRDYESFLPLAIAHRSSLSALLNRKSELKARCKDFGNILYSKEQELDQRFEVIVRTQELLDGNPIPDHIVSRVSNLVEEHWQGDARLVGVIAQGEEQQSRDLLLDEPFSKIWRKVSMGTFDKPTGLKSHGLLEDLEMRVASQEARLNQWKEFKEAIQRDIKPTTNLKVQSPTSVRPKGVNPDLQKQRDLVFSPRKSPRKSNWDIEEEEESPTATRVKCRKTDLKEARDLVFSPKKSPRKSDWEGEGAEKQQSLSSPTSLSVKSNGATPSPSMKMLNYPNSSDARNGVSEGQERSLSSISHHDSSIDDSDQSGFSAISGGHLHYRDRSDDVGGVRESSNHSQDGDMGYEHSQRDLPEAHDQRLHQPDKIGSTKKNEIVDEDELLAEQIISMTLNAAPTPAKPKLSLMQRTRQSMKASASPGGLQRLATVDDELPSPLLTAMTDQRELSSTHPNGPSTLLERTRQSISLVPSRPSASRNSMHERRASKVYPANQFETPRKQMPRIKEFTPPEELFSPGAGYDSVFKSRPKVGFSPVASPTPDKSPGEGVDEGMNVNAWEESPSARASAKV